MLYNTKLYPYPRPLPGGEGRRLRKQNVRSLASLTAIDNWLPPHRGGLGWGFIPSIHSIVILTAYAERHYQNIGHPSFERQFP